MAAPRWLHIPWLLLLALVLLVLVSALTCLLSLIV